MGSREDLTAHLHQHEENLGYISVPFLNYLPPVDWAEINIISELKTKI